MQKIHDLLTQFRPQTLGEIVGQQRIVKTLSNMVAKDRLPTALLFTGEYGSGKTTMARIIGKTLICERRIKQTEPCNVCDSCRSFIYGSSWSGIYFSASQKVSDESLTTEIRAVRDANYLFGGRKSFLIIDDFDLLPAKQQEFLRHKLDDCWPAGHLIAISPKAESVDKALLSRMCQFPLTTPLFADMVQWVEALTGQIGVTIKDNEVIGRLVAVGSSNFRSILKIMQTLYAEDSTWTVEMVDASAMQNEFNAEF